MSERVGFLKDYCIWVSWMVYFSRDEFCNFIGSCCWCSCKNHMKGFAYGLQIWKICEELY